MKLGVTGAKSGLEGSNDDEDEDVVDVLFTEDDDVDVV